MMPSPEQIKKSLFALTAKGIKYDLDRIRAAAKQIGNPHDSYPSIHVAGTNGKGSTCAFIERILRSAGYSTGLFTSPHIVRFEERFRINGKPVKESEWVDSYFQVKEIVEACQLTFFEATMLMAGVLFKQHQIDYGIFETGLGGRLDATNILHPIVTVVTNIALDHADYLGSTLIEVAREKLGIVKKGVPLVAAEPSVRNIRDEMLVTCKEKCSECTFVNSSGAGYVFNSETGVADFLHEGMSYSMKMAGEYQVINAKCAIEAVHRCGEKISENVIRKGIGETTLRCRFDKYVIGDKTFIFDVAHNPDAVEQLCITLKKTFPSEKICFVTGIMKDKNFSAMLSEYDKIALHIICTKPSTERAASAELLFAALKSDKKSKCSDIGTAIASVKKRPEKIICVTGSFYTVGEALTFLQLDPAG